MALLVQLTTWSPAPVASPSPSPVPACGQLPSHVPFPARGLVPSPAPTVPAHAPDALPGGVLGERRYYCCCCCCHRCRKYFPCRMHSRCHCSRTNERRRICSDRGFSSASSCAPESSTCFATDADPCCKRKTRTPARVINIRTGFQA